MSKARRPASIVKMNNRTGVNEKKFFNITRERNNANQSEKKESPLCFPFDHIYARQADSAERKLVGKEKADEVAQCLVSDKVPTPAAAAKVRALPTKLFSAYTPHPKASEWRPGEHESYIGDTYQRPIEENKISGVKMDNKQGSVATRRPLQREKPVQLPAQCPATDDKLNAPGSSTDNKKTTKKLITIYASKRPTSRPEQQDKTKEVPSQCITPENKDTDTDKVKKLSERLMAVYTRMKNSEKKSMQQVPLELAAQYIFPPIRSVAGAELLSQNVAAATSVCELSAALGRHEIEAELVSRLGLNRHPNELVDIHQLSNSFVLTSQFKQLRELLVYHLDLIQNLNETITSTTKLYQDLKEENDTLKNVIKRKALPGSPQFALSHTVSRHVVTTTTATSTLTSILAPTRHQNPNEMVMSRDNVTMRKMFGPVRSETTRLSSTGVSCARNYSAPRSAPATCTLTSCEPFSTFSSCLATPSATVTSRDLLPAPPAAASAAPDAPESTPQAVRGRSGRTARSLSLNKRTQKRVAALGTTHGTALGTGHSTTLGTALTTTHGAPLADVGRSRGTRTFSANKKPKPRSVSGAEKGEPRKRSADFGSLSDRLQLIDTTPTGEDPYQLGEADMREHSPIPKLMLQKTGLGRRKPCPAGSVGAADTGGGASSSTGSGTIGAITGAGAGMSSGTVAQKRTTIYDVPASDGTLKSSLKSHRYSLDGPIKYSSITEQPPRTLMTEDPDTESEGAWRVADELRGAAAIYGDPPADLPADLPVELPADPAVDPRADRAPLIDFRNIFAADVPHSDDMKPVDSCDDPAPAPKKRRGRKDSVDRPPRASAAPRKRSKPSGTATESAAPTTSRRNTSRRRRAPTGPNAEDTCSTVRPKKKGRRAAGAGSTSDDEPIDPADRGTTTHVTPSVTNAKKGRNGGAVSETSETVRSAGPGGTPQSPPTSLKRRPRSRNTSAPGESPAELFDPTTFAYGSPAGASPSTGRANRARTTSAPSDLPEPLYPADAVETVPPVPKKKRGRPRSRNASAAEELATDDGGLPANRSTDYSSPLDSRLKNEWPFSGALSFSEALYSTESGTDTKAPPTTPKRGRGRPRSRAASTTDEMPLDAYSPVKDSSTNYSLLPDAEGKDEWTYSDDINLSVSFYSRREDNTTKTTPRRRGRPRSRTPSTTNELPAELYSPIKRGSAKYSLPSTNEASMEPLYSSAANSVTECSPSAPKKRKGRQRNVNKPTASELPSNYSSPLYPETLYSHAPSYLAESDSGRKCLPATPKRRRGRPRSRNTSTTGELPADLYTSVNDTSTIFSDSGTKTEWPYSGSLSLSETPYSAESGPDEKRLPITPKRGRGRPRSRAASTADEMPLEAYSPVKDSCTNYSTLPDADLKDEWSYSDDINLSVSFYSKRADNMGESSPAAPGRRGGGPRSRTTSTNNDHGGVAAVTENISSDPYGDPLPGAGGAGGAAARKRRGRPSAGTALRDYEMRVVADGGAGRGRGGRGSRGRRRAHSTTVLADLYEEPARPHNARRSAAASAPCKTTRVPYSTQLGGTASPSPPCSDDDVLAARAARQSLIEVPRWREKRYTSLPTAEGAEPPDERERLRRHRKLEAEEKRQQRWYVRRLREERHMEHLRRRERARSGAPQPAARPSRPPRSSLLHPPPHDPLYIELTDRLPVVAFGEPLRDLPPKPFMLKWMKISKALKRMKRSRTLQ